MHRDVVRAWRQGQECAASEVFVETLPASREAEEDAAIWAIILNTAAKAPHNLQGGRARLRVGQGEGVTPARESHQHGGQSDVWSE